MLSLRCILSAKRFVYNGHTDRFHQSNDGLQFVASKKVCFILGETLDGNENVAVIEADVSPIEFDSDDYISSSWMEYGNVTITDVQCSLWFIFSALLLDGG